MVVVQKARLAAVHNPFPAGAEKLKRVAVGMDMAEFVGVGFATEVETYRIVGPG